ncbi:hypothetical protein [Nocardioides taihuensis]|uniref:Uncharacterized protein n=1 Tax=Nocardioides taihuensis TaxID=1835606 RepID=A0ABW0BDB8_9ACTN
MNPRTRAAALGGAAALAIAMLTPLAVAEAGVAPHSSGSVSASAVDKVGSGMTVSRKSVVLRDLRSTAPTQKVRQPGPLTITGKPTFRSYGRAPAVAAKTASQSGPAVNGSVRTNATGPLVTPPTVITKNWNGLSQANSSCNCQPPDPNAAAGATQTVQAVNLSVAVWSKANPPALQKNTALSTFLGESRPLSDPRVAWDPNWKRWVLTAIPIPTASTSAPGLDLAVSKTSNATGAWWIYKIGFSGGSFPAGTLLDYPMLGQQQDALVWGTNNYQLDSVGNYNYIGSTAFAVPKARAYNGLGFNFPAFGVAFSTHPADTGNIPMDSDGNAYLMAADDANDRMILYRMNNATYSNLTSLSLVGTPAVAFAAPPRGAHQPGGAPDVDALDGRIAATPVVSNGFVWFAHGIALGSYPAVQYGAVATSGASATVATAFHSATSDDINPSIGFFPTAASGGYIYLNWAYSDAANNIGISDTVSGVSPGEGVPALVGLDTTLITGGTSGQTRFGDYSSVSITPYAKNASCGVGRTAYTAQQYFSGGVWATRLAQVGFC